ncbi:hypothetical protein ACERII_16480 [Evansella sp. AB-rgal1]|uniref:hypothetical protein n=1 Tax=Evansella sp. AB-rgal1 TaxID=3242696 RepID=UPI00359DFB62
METSRNEELTQWKQELQSRKDEIIKRKHIIETKLDKYKTRLRIASSIEESNKGAIVDSLESQVTQFRRELEEFSIANEPEIRELDSILKSVERELARS